MTNPHAIDASKSAEANDAAAAIAALKAVMADFAAQKTAQEGEIRRLMDAEDPARGIFFARELHEARHEKMRLETEIQFCTARIRRLELGIVENLPPNLDRGFPF
jgi:hypothetical protein